MNEELDYQEQLIYEDDVVTDELDYQEQLLYEDD